MVAKSWGFNCSKYVDYRQRRALLVNDETPQISKNSFGVFGFEGAAFSASGVDERHNVWRARAQREPGTMLFDEPTSALIRNGVVNVEGNASVNPRHDVLVSRTKMNFARNNVKIWLWLITI